jgi:hypothetical protein
MHARRQPRIHCQAMSQEVKYHPSSVDLELVKRLAAITHRPTLLQFLVKEFSCIPKALAGMHHAAKSSLMLRALVRRPKSYTSNVHWAQNWLQPTEVLTGHTQPLVLSENGPVHNHSQTRRASGGGAAQRRHAGDAPRGARHQAADPVRPGRAWANRGLHTGRFSVGEARQTAVVTAGWPPTPMKHAGCTSCCTRPSSRTRTAPTSARQVLRLLFIWQHAA